MTQTPPSQAVAERIFDIIQERGNTAYLWHEGVPGDEQSQKERHRLGTIALIQAELARPLEVAAPVGGAPWHIPVRMWSDKDKANFLSDNPAPPRCRNPGETDSDYRAAMGWDKPPMHSCEKDARDGLVEDLMDVADALQKDQKTALAAILQRAIAWIDAASRVPVALPAPGSVAVGEPDPMDMRLPCDVTVGHGTHHKGTTLRSLVLRMKALYEMATGNNADEVAGRSIEERKALFDKSPLNLDNYTVGGRFKPKLSPEAQALSDQLDRATPPGGAGGEVGADQEVRLHVRHSEWQTLSPEAQESLMNMGRRAVESTREQRRRDGIARANFPAVPLSATPAAEQGDAKGPDSFHSDSGECGRVQGPGPTDKAFVKLRFFRDLSQDQRLSLFRTFADLDGTTASEVRTHADETILFNFVWLSTWCEKFVRAIDAAILASGKAGPAAGEGK